MVTGSTEQSSHYMRVVPDSHYWTDLDMLIRALEFDVEWHKNKKKRKKRMKKSKYPIIDAYEPLTIKYILIGLKNARDKGYKLRKPLFSRIKIKQNGKKRSI